jgi:hypothetical protein
MVPPASRRGFVQMELMLLIGLVGIGLMVGWSSFLKLVQHQPMSGGNWAALILGAFMIAGGVAPVLMNSLSNAFKSRGR